MRNFANFFNTATESRPYEYQCRLACGNREPGEAEEVWLCESTPIESRLINIPTGLGKTAAVVLAWLWNRLLPQIRNPKSEIRNPKFRMASPSRLLPANADAYGADKPKQKLRAGGKSYMNQLTQFRDAFEKLTGDQPFPWQEDLYTEWFSKGKFPLLCNLPTGLGKTSVVAIWLIALASWPEKMPRRLVYVVNRRTVLDQTTEEVLKYRQRIEELDENDLLKHNLESLAISTLRGQFADNREWSADPSRPAVIVGTVDMIGSRLLFSGYGVGFKAKPLHAYWTGSLHSREYQPREKLAHYPRWHVRLTFDQPRTGPLVIGAGRHCGFGLMAGADYSCRHYLRQMSIDQ